MLLLHLALIVILSKLVSALAAKYKQPPVLGMLLLGLLLGPSGFHFIDSEIVLKSLAKLGVLILIFMVGLETDFGGMRRQGRASFLAALGGVIFPFGLGIGTALFFNYGLLEGFVIGTILTATSVSVTAMTLIDLGKLKTAEGTTILGAAILDDIFGILLISIILSLGGGQTNIWAVLGKIILFFFITTGIGIFAFPKLMRFSERLHVPHGAVAIALGLAFLYAWIAELGGIAYITGAYLAGLFLGRTTTQRRIIAGMETLGQSLFTAIFFVNIGLETELKGLSESYLFVLIFVLAAILGKVIGSGIGSWTSGFNRAQSLRVGIGMMPRGEVALVVASVGLSNQLIGQVEYSGTVVMAILTALLTPFLLKLAFGKKEIQDNPPGELHA